MDSNQSMPQNMQDRRDWFLYLACLVNDANQGKPANTLWFDVHPLLDQDKLIQTQYIRNIDRQHLEGKLFAGIGILMASGAEREEYRDAIKPMVSPILECINRIAEAHQGWCDFDITHYLPELGKPRFVLHVSPAGLAKVGALEGIEAISRPHLRSLDKPNKDELAVIKDWKNLYASMVEPWPGIREQLIEKFSLKPSGRHFEHVMDEVCASWLRSQKEGRERAFRNERRRQDLATVSFELGLN